jgi:hypothetical protein
VARSADELLKLYIGELTFQQALLRAELEALKEKHAQVEAELAALKAAAGS